MGKVSSFPFISIPEFDEACEELYKTYTLHSGLQNEWLSMDVMQQNDSNYLKIVKPLSATAPNQRTGDVGLEEDEFEEDDEVCERSWKRDMYIKLRPGSSKSTSNPPSHSGVRRSTLTQLSSSGPVLQHQRPQLPISTHNGHFISPSHSSTF